MSDNTISILDGSTFLVSAPNGDIDAGPTQGAWFLRFFAFFRRMLPTSIFGNDGSQCFALETSESHIRASRAVGQL